MGYEDNKTRLFTPIRLKTPAFQRRGLHLGAGRERSRSALRGDDVAGKRSHRNGSSSFERVRLLQPLLPRPQKGWRPPAHPRSQTPESRPHETAVQDDHAEADPLADSHRGLVLFSGPERRILSHPDSPPSQTILFFVINNFLFFFFTHNTISKIKQNKTADTYSTSQGSIKREGEREGQLEHKSYSFK